MALPISYGFWKLDGGISPLPAGVLELVLLFIAGVLAAGSRDVLRKYYAGGLKLLGEQGAEVMTNGNHGTKNDKADGRDGRTKAISKPATTEQQGKESVKPQK